MLFFFQLINAFETFILTILRYLVLENNSHVLTQHVSDLDHATDVQFLYQNVSENEGTVETGPKLDLYSLDSIPEDHLGPVCRGSKIPCKDVLP